MKGWRSGHDLAQVDLRLANQIWYQYTTIPSTRGKYTHLAGSGQLSISAMRLNYVRANQKTIPRFSRLRSTHEMKIGG